MSKVKAEKTELIEASKNEVSTEVLEKFLGSSFPSLPAKVKDQFFEMAKAFNLNPFKREIYLTGYGSNFSIITGYEVYLKRAELSGKLDGWEVSTELKDTVILNSKTGQFETKQDLVATCIIHRKDFSKPFAKSVNFSEYVQRTKDGKINRMWQTKPRTMLEKVATAQAFRLAFPLELGGIPYQAEEMGHDPIDVSPKSEPTPEPVQEVEAQIVEPQESLKELSDKILAFETYPELQKFGKGLAARITHLSQDEHDKLSALYEQRTIEFKTNVAIAEFRKAGNLEDLEKAWSLVATKIGLKKDKTIPPSISDAFLVRKGELESVAELGAIELSPVDETPAAEEELIY